jgi:hypothetical protein
MGLVISAIKTSLKPGSVFESDRWSWDFGDHTLFAPPFYPYRGRWVFESEDGRLHRLPEGNDWMLDGLLGLATTSVSPESDERHYTFPIDLPTFKGLMKSVNIAAELSKKEKELEEQQAISNKAIEDSQRLIDELRKKIEGVTREKQEWETHANRLEEELRNGRKKGNGGWTGGSHVE